MSDLMYRNKLFSSREMIFLSAYAGMEKFRILSGDEQKMPEQAELNTVLFQLYQKGILCWNGENSYELSPDVRGLFYDMKYASKELEICSGKQGSMLHCFWNTNVVVMELSQNDTDRIKIHSLSVNDFLTELCDRGILPERSSLESDGEENDRTEAWESFLQSNTELVQNGQIRREELQRLLGGDNELSAYITIYDRATEQEQSVILLLDCGLYDCIVYMEQDSVRAGRFSAEDLKKLLLL